MTQVHPDEAPDLEPVDILILGAGWTATFLIPLCEARGLAHAATSRSGRAGTLPFHFDPEAQDDPAQYAKLPRARTVLITFPITAAGASARLLSSYRAAHDGEGRFVQLGTTSIWGVSAPFGF